MRPHLPKSVDGLWRSNYQSITSAKNRNIAERYQSNLWRNLIMAFFQSAVGTLQTLVIALGAGLGIWGAINLMEGYGNDNPGAKSQGMKHMIPK